MHKCIGVFGDAGWKIDGLEEWEPHEVGATRTFWAPASVTIEDDGSGLVRVYVDE